MHRQQRIPTVLCLIPFVTFSLGGAPQDLPTTTIKMSTQEVVLDVVVRDSHGKIVKGLTQKDFQIVEDDAPQQIKSFSFIQGRDVLQTQQAGSGSRAPATVANPLRAVNLVCIVYQNLDPYTKKDAIAASKEFLTSHFSPDTWIAVYSLTGDLVALHPFTTNRAELLKAADRAFSGVSMDFVSSATEVMNATANVDYTASTGQSGNSESRVIAAPGKVTGGELNTLVNNDAAASTSEAANRQRGDLAGQRRQFGGVEAQRQTDQILNLITKLATLPGRKSVLLVSPGLPSDGDADLFKAVLNKANKADITFYGLDVNGLTENSNVGAANNAVGHVASLSSSQRGNAANGTGQGGVAMEQMRQDDYLVQAVRGSDTQSGLRALSEGTGGFLIGSTNDYRKPFQKLVEDVETHYELIYHPSEEKMDGHLRTIAVKMARPDLVAESRHGYFALPMLGGSSDLAPFEMAGLAALNYKEPPHAFPFRSAAYHFRPGATDSQGEVSFELPVASLTSVPEPQKKQHQFNAAIFALIKDANGEVVDKFSRSSPYEIPDENLSSAEKSDIIFSHPLTLPPGRYSVDVAALDRESTRISTAKLAFDVPVPKGVGISSIALVQRVDAVKGNVDKNEPFEFQSAPTEGRRVTPELGSSLKADAHPYVYFVVYPDPALTDKPKIQVEFRVGGQTLAKQTADLPAPDASGAVPMLIGAASRPGDCELRITALQGGSQAQEKLDYTIAAK